MDDIHDDLVDDVPDAGSRTEVVETRYRWDETDPTAAIVQSVAAVTGREPTAMRPVYDVLNPDALNELLTFDGQHLRERSLRVTVTYEGCEVVLAADGRLAVALTE
jgi:hypothetical protein